MIKREKTRKNPKKWRFASLAASGGGSAALGWVGGSTPHPLLAMPGVDYRFPTAPEMHLKLR